MDDLEPTPDAVVSTASSVDVVEAAYRVLLGRSAEPEGLSEHLNGLGPSPSMAQLASFLNAALTSDEGKAHVRSVVDPRTDAALIALANEGAATFVSLGRHCITAQTLRAMGLRRSSYPFDWLFSNFAMIEDCIDDDFKLFLDRDQYEPIPLEARPDPGAGYAHHRTFRLRYGGLPIFNHHDMTEPANHAHFERAVDRFRALKSSPGSVVYIAFADRKSEDLSYVGSLSKKLARRGQDFVIIVDVDERASIGYADNPQITTERVDEVLFKAAFKPISPMLGLNFGVAFDDFFLQLSLNRLFHGLLANQRPL